MWCHFYVQIGKNKKVSRRLNCEGCRKAGVHKLLWDSELVQILTPPVEWLRWKCTCPARVRPKVQTPILKKIRVICQYLSKLQLNIYFGQNVQDCTLKR
jgi:hypothetical protein